MYVIQGQETKSLYLILEASPPGVQRSISLSCEKAEGWKCATEGVFTNLNKGMPMNMNEHNN